MLSGCPDTEGGYEAFVERYDLINASSSSGTGGGGGQTCVVPAAGTADGEFLFALSARLGPKTPILFEAQLTTTDNDGALQITLNLEPISKDDRTTLLGNPFDTDTAEVDAETGQFSLAMPSPLAITGDANPISGSDLAADDVIITGHLCGEAGEGGGGAGGGSAAVDFICGDVTGTVTAPITAPLTGSTFTMERVEGSYPEPPKINCAMDEADPLGG